VEYIENNIRAGHIVSLCVSVVGLKLWPDTENEIMLEGLQN
jgi:hypothetical protein